MLVSSSLRMHFLLALSAFVVLGTISLRTINLSASVSEDPTVQVVDMAVEHTQNLGVNIAMSTLDGQSIMEIGHDGDETIFVSLPEHWIRGEVRHANIGSIISETPMLGFTRWHIPAGSSVTFQALEAPDSILVHNPSKVPLKVKYVVVNLETEDVLQGVRLIMDDSVQLW